MMGGQETEKPFRISTIVADLYFDGTITINEMTAIYGAVQLIKEAKDEKSKLFDKFVDQFGTLSAEGMVTLYDII